MLLLHKQWKQHVPHLSLTLPRTIECVLTTMGAFGTDTHTHCGAVCYCACWQQSDVLAAACVQKENTHPRTLARTPPKQTGPRLCDNSTCTET